MDDIGTLAPGQTVTVTLRTAFSGVAGPTYAADAPVASSNPDLDPTSSSLVESAPASPGGFSGNPVDVSLVGVGAPNPAPAADGSLRFDLIATNSSEYDNASNVLAHIALPINASLQSVQAPTSATVLQETES